MLSSVIIYDRLGVPSRVAHQSEALGLRPFGLVSEHSQRQKVTDTLVTRAGFESVGWRKGRRQAHERRGQHFLPPTIPRWHWSGRERERGARRTGCPASGWGLAFVAPSRHGIYAGGVAADPSSQPALPISKRNLGRLDIRENSSVYRTMATLGVSERPL